MTNRLLSFVALLLFGTNAFLGQAQTSYYFPDNKSGFDPAIPTPEQFLGYPIGSHFTRYDRIVDYLKELDRLSDKVSLQPIGKTYEERPQVIAFFTSATNGQNLAQLRQQHLALSDPKAPAPDYAKLPVMVHLAYTVHGNESSSSEAALLTAYYLTASTSPDVTRWLSAAVVTIDPAENPDGRDRATQWFNQHKSFPPVTDPADREHNEGWPNGRFNHYLNDLNRDWLPLAHVESRNRIKFHHDWLPNVMIDFHEMGTGSTYYFEPSKPFSTENDLIPRATYEVLNVRLAKYFARALDGVGSLYWTKEQFDNLSPIYGSTYPDFTGGVGVTFEVGSSRGLAQEAGNGRDAGPRDAGPRDAGPIVTFPFTIRNHLRTGLAAVQGAVEEKELYLKHQRDFFASALTDAAKFPTKAYVFGSATDPNLTRRFADLLLRHSIQLYALPQATQAGGKSFAPGTAYVVPTAQPHYRLVHSIFEEVTAFHDSVFYDVTGWSLIHGYGLPYAKMKETSLVKGEPVKTLPPVAGGVAGGPSAVAYVLNGADYHATQAVSLLQQAGVLTKVSFKPFRIQPPGPAGSGAQSLPRTAGITDFGYGAIVVPVTGQKQSPDSLYRLVAATGQRAGVLFTGVSTGFNAQGIDLGSNNIRALRKPEVALVVGPGVNPSEAGEVWFLTSEQLNLPITKLDLGSLARVDWNRYNTVILVGGQYNAIDKAVVGKLKSWVENGGTLITTKTASEWAVRQGLTRENLLAVGKPDTTKAADRTDFERVREREGTRAVAGSIYTADVDITHPLGFGLTDRRLFVFRNGTTYLKSGSSPYNTVVKYAANPLVSGYVSKENLSKTSSSAAVVVSPEGQGRVVLFADNPAFRSYWHGTSRLLLNALLYGPLLNVPIVVPTGEE